MGSEEKQRWVLLGLQCNLSGSKRALNEPLLSKDPYKHTANLQPETWENLIKPAWVINGLPCPAGLSPPSCLCFPSPTTMPQLFFPCFASQLSFPTCEPRNLRKQRFSKRKRGQGNRKADNITINNHPVQSTQRTAQLSLSLCFSRASQESWLLPRPAASRCAQFTALKPQPVHFSQSADTQPASQPAVHLSIHLSISPASHPH